MTSGFLVSLYLHRAAQSSAQEQQKTPVCHFLAGRRVQHLAVLAGSLPSFFSRDLDVRVQE
jgi:hypothetical protein